MFAHLSSLAGGLLTAGVGGWGGFIGPLVIWLVKKDTMRFVDDQGNVTAGGDPGSSVDGPTSAGDHLTVDIVPADRVEDGSLLINFPTHNVSSDDAFISGLDWSVSSGNDQYNRQGDHSSPIVPGGTRRLTPSKARWRP